MIIDLQSLQGFEHGVMDAIPSDKSLGVQLSDGEHMGEDTSDEDPVFFLYPLSSDYAAHSIVCISTVNAELQDRASGNGGVALMECVGGIIT